MSDKSAAYHEAGHTAVGFLLGHSPGKATIIPADTTEGRMRHLDGDDMTAEGMENLVMMLYAGADAEKRVDSDHDAVKLGATGDNEEAEDYLALLNATEDDLRKRAAKLLSDNWRLVELIAAELLIHGTLDYQERDILFDIYRGEMTIQDIEYYRAHWKR